MTFLSAFLWPLAAIALIPLAVHLINKRKPSEKYFAAFEFLLKIDKITRRRIRFHSLLLYVIRTAVLLVIILAALKPVVYKGILKTENRSGRIMVLVDPSLSMRVIRNGETAFRTGLNFVGKYAEREGIREVFIALPEREIEKVQLNGFASEFSGKTANLQPGYGRGDITGAIPGVQRFIDTEKKIDRLFVVSDFCSHEWSLSPDSLFSAIRVPVVLCNTSDSTSVNRGITGASIVSKNDGVAVNMTFVNSSALPVNNWPVYLHISNRNIMNVFVDCDANASISKPLLLSGYESEVPGQLRLAGSDSLPEDDVRYFVMQPAGQVKALVVDGDQAAHIIDAESYYFEKALGADQTIKVTLTTPTALNMKDIDKSDVVCLLNHVPDDALAEYIVKQTKNGKGLFVSLGNRIDIDDFNKKFSGVTGTLLRNKKAGFGREFAETEALEMPVRQHPAIAALASLKDGSNYLFNNLFLAESGTDKLSESLLKLQSGDPLLKYCEYGSGRSALFLSTIDMSWNNFPLRPYYVPFVRDLIRFLSKKTHIDVADSSFCGDSIVLECSANQLFVEDPEGERHSVICKNEAAVFYGSALPGIYKFFNDKGTRLFAVNTPPSESELSFVGEKEIARIAAGSMYTVVDVRYKNDAEVKLPRPIWHYLFVAIALLLLAEVLVAAYKRKEKDA